MASLTLSKANWNKQLHQSSQSMKASSQGCQKKFQWRDLKNYMCIYPQRGQMAIHRSPMRKGNQQPTLMKLKNNMPKDPSFLLSTTCTYVLSA